MEIRLTIQVIATLAIGYIGSLLANAAGLPAGAIIGSAFAVSLASFFRFPCHIPNWLRNTGFAAIGCSLGSGVNTDFLDLVNKWPLSLLGLTVAMVLIFIVTSWLIVHFFGLSWETAILATSPGALSCSLAMAAEGIGDAQAIIVIQSFRLLAVTISLPLIIDIFDLPSGLGVNTIQTFLSMPVTAGLFLMTLIIGFLLNKLSIPASFLISGILISGILHYQGLISGKPQNSLLFIGFIITGSVLGSRFSRIPLINLKQMVSASMTVFVVATLIATLLAWFSANLLDLPFGQVWISYAPGGVEAMAAMAIALGYDSAFVATHHLYRIVLLLLMLPIFIRLFNKASLKNICKQNTNIEL